MKILIFGPPGSGKGTQSILIAKKYNLSHLSTGELLRKTKDEDVQRRLRTGILIPDEEMSEMVRRELKKIGDERISDNDSNNGYTNGKNYSIGYILDGFPRTLVQAKQLPSPDLAILITLPDAVCVERIKNRGQNRSDDNELVAKKRLNVYLENTMPVMEFYKEKNLLKEVDGSLSVEKVFAKVENMINEMLSK